MRALLLAALLLLAGALAPAAHAGEKDVQVYFFWEMNSPESHKVRAILAKAQASDPSVHVSEFEVEEHLVNAVLLAKVFRRIGLPDFTVVPLVIVGHHIIIGYTAHGDATERDIARVIDECRKLGCRDVLRPLIEGVAEASLTLPVTPAPAAFPAGPRQ
jgi:hypothetical protein